VRFFFFLFLLFVVVVIGGGGLLIDVLFWVISTLEGSNNQVSEQGLRKSLYQKIVAAFPDGWMSSGQISRDGEGFFLLLSQRPTLLSWNPLILTTARCFFILVSSMKKKFEKEAMENES
jgi:Ubinuclein conserved middle domain